MIFVIVFYYPSNVPRNDKINLHLIARNTRDEAI